MTGAIPWSDPLVTDVGLPSVLRPGGPRAHALAQAEALAAASPEALAPEVLVLVDAMIDHLRGRAVDDPPWVLDGATLSPEGLRLLGQILGAGEVSGRVEAPDGGRVTVAESVLTGVWVLDREDSAGHPVARWIEIAAIPQVVATTRPPRTTAALDPPPPPPVGALVVMPLLAEIADHAIRHVPGQPNHVITLTLLPMTKSDLVHLGLVLGRGPVALCARGHGSCLIQATGIDRVWSVRFLNASGTVILDTLEVGDVPLAVRAAPEDFTDSAGRLADIRDAYL